MLSEIRSSKNLARLVCLALAAVFIISSVAKLVYFSNTISYFLGFRIFVPFAALLLTSLLISMELALGVALIVERNPVKPLLISAGVFAVFTMYQFVMLLFPVTFTETCPCFGTSAAAAGINWLHVLRNVFLTALAVGCYFYYKRNPKTI